MSMSSLTDALQMEKSVEESLRNMQGVTSLGVLDPNGSILSVKNFFKFLNLQKSGKFEKKPELLAEVYHILKDVRGIVKKEKVENITSKKKKKLKIFFSKF
jgi:hypothetical protein